LEAPDLLHGLFHEGALAEDQVWRVNHDSATVYKRNSHGLCNMGTTVPSPWSAMVAARRGIDEQCHTWASSLVMWKTKPSPQRRQSIWTRASGAATNGGESILRSLAPCTAAPRVVFHGLPACWPPRVTASRSRQGSCRGRGWGRPCRHGEVDWGLILLSTLQFSPSYFCC
jgi:hypothetical protein